MTGTKRIDRKSLLVWTLFATAVLRILWVFEFVPWVNYLIYPGIIFGLYMAYFLIKNRSFLSYWGFALSVLSMSVAYHMFDFLVHQYIGMFRLNGSMIHGVISIVASLVLASVIYVLLLPFKRRFAS